MRCAVKKEPKIWPPVPMLDSWACCRIFLELRGAPSADPFWLTPRLSAPPLQPAAPAGSQSAVRGDGLAGHHRLDVAVRLSSGHVNVIGKGPGRNRVAGQEVQVGHVEEDGAHFGHPGAEGGVRGQGAAEHRLGRASAASSHTAGARLQRTSPQPPPHLRMAALAMLYSVNCTLGLYTPPEGGP